MTPILPPAEPPVEKMERLEFYVPGVPVPQGSMKGFIVKGHVNIVHSNADKLKPWRKKIAAAALEAADGRLFTDAVAVLLDFHVPRPKTVKRKHPTVKPDGDKYVRCVLDALTKTVYRDDGQVCVIHAEKSYAEKPGVRIVVRELA